MRRIVLIGLLLIVSGCGSGASTLSNEDLGQADHRLAPDVAPTPDDTAVPLDSTADSAPDYVAEAIADFNQDAGPVLGGAGYPCQVPDDCNEPYCIETLDGKQCSVTCFEECPFGWDCVQYAPALPDQLFICAPAMLDLCRPCQTNSDCMTNGVDTGQACLDYGGAGFFCGSPCKESADCPDGYECMEMSDAAGGLVVQCGLAQGQCTCSKLAADEGAWTQCYVENDFGKCTGQRGCDATGLTDCTAAFPEEEVCDGADNNCNGQVDEDTSGAQCLVPSPFGNCPGMETCADGQLVCEGEEAKPEACDGTDNDCDGEIDEGFPDTDNDGTADCLENDKDGDGVVDGQDNCPGDFNPGQSDTDVDNFGDACDQDDDNDQTPDSEDCAPKDVEIHPGAEEVCDGKDNDCNLIVDEGFADADQDGWKNCVDDDDDNDGFDDAGDCSPTDAAVFPGAPEQCDGKDNDCDFDVDEGYPDSDGDGTPDCLDDDQDGDGIPDATDNCPAVENPAQEDLDQDLLGDACDPDADGDSIPDAGDNCTGLKNTLQVDTDSDGIGDECDGDKDGDGVLNDLDNCPLVPNLDQSDSDLDLTGDACEDDKDGDGAPDGQDCAPLNPDVFPGAPEECDGVDNDCNYVVDEGYPDLDADGLKNCIDLDDDDDGDPDDSDCAPLNKQIHAGALELCDGLDNDCDKLADEELGALACGKGECFHTVPTCKDGTLQACDPFLGAKAESCDGKDNDCDGIVDEDLGHVSCGLGACAHLEAVCVEGAVNQCDAFLDAAVEICDGIDNDCDGMVDEELGTLTCGQGVCQHTVNACIGGVEQQCNPFDNAQQESCDGLDNNCNGFVDEELGQTTCGLGECLHTVDNCKSGLPQICNPLEGLAPEACDGSDNDCDGLVDEELGATSCGLGPCFHEEPNCLDGVPQQCDPLLGAVPEQCDGTDNNCDGNVDEGFDDWDGDQAADCVDDDDDNDGDADDTDCLDNDPQVNSQADEICFNAKDDDCNPDTPDECVFSSCKERLEAVPGTVSGNYTLDLDGDGPLNAVEVYCDMDTDGGGWTGFDTLTAYNLLGGTLVAVVAGHSAGIDAQGRPWTFDQGPGHLYHYTFNVPFGYSAFYLKDYYVKANAGAGYTSDMSQNDNFYHTSWTQPNPTSWGDVMVGSADQPPITSYAKENDTSWECQSCEKPWPAPDKTWSVGGVKTQFRIGCTEDGGQHEGWYMWWSGLVMVR